MSDLTVIKCNAKGQEVWRYQGRMLERNDNRIVLEAFFNRSDMDFYGMFLGKGDRFIETYYNDRWYNIYEIHARESDQLRGWYCNICLPAKFSDSAIYWNDLALDLMVFPDGRQLILDEEEFKHLDIKPELRKKALAALEELKLSFNTEYPPYQEYNPHNNIQLPARLCNNNTGEARSVSQ